ncbi:MAG: hypothetical protein WBV94_29070 [Blastocatellia bacterium]
MAYRTTRRRQRQNDPLASVAAVRAILEALRSALPTIIPQRDKELVRLLRAVRHISRYPATDTRRGRPTHWKRESLLLVQTRLAALLSRETNDRISASSFIDHYLRILQFPADVLQAVESGQINLFEASQLARIRSGRNGLTHAEAERQRCELLATHLQARLSGSSLRLRVGEILGAHPSNGQAEAQPAEMDALEDFDPHDPLHLFWEEIKQLGFAFREIKREDLDDALLEELLKASQPVWTVLEKIKKRKQRPVVQKLVF